MHSYQIIAAATRDSDSWCREKTLRLIPFNFVEEGREGLHFSFLIIKGKFHIVGQQNSD